MTIHHLLLTKNHKTIQQGLLKYCTVITDIIELYLVIKIGIHRIPVWHVNTTRRSIHQIWRNCVYQFINTRNVYLITVFSGWTLFKISNFSRKTYKFGFKLPAFWRYKPCQTSLTHFGVKTLCTLRTTYSYEKKCQIFLQWIIQTWNNGSKEILVSLFHVCSRLLFKCGNHVRWCVNVYLKQCQNEWKNFSKIWYF